MRMYVITYSPQTNAGITINDVTRSYICKADNVAEACKDLIDQVHCYDITVKNVYSEEIKE